MTSHGQNKLSGGINVGSLSVVLVSGSWVASGVLTSVVCRFRLLKGTVVLLGSGESAVRDMGEKIFS